MRRLFSVTSMLLVLCGGASAKIVDRIVAQVNDDIITQSDVDRRLAETRKELSEQYTGNQLTEAIKKAEKQALDKMIEEKLLLQKATELGFKADVDLQVSSYIEELRKQYNFKDTAEFEKVLAQQGTTMSEFREQLKNQIIISSLVSEMIGSRISILSQDVEKYYKDHIKDFTTPEEVTLSEIVISGEGSDKANEAKADEIYQSLKKGESFATLATQFSKGPTAGKGGSIGSYLTSNLSADIVRAIANVKVGEISEVEKAKGSCAIYRVDERKEAKARPLDEVRDEIRKTLYNQKYEPEYERYIAQLKTDAYIQIFSETK
jgi:peptidyl-prolyl cis-trans isomerase SurA